MLHKFFEEGAWFAPKRFGYGAGLPIAWQGWVVLGAYFLIVIGLSALLRRPDAVTWALWASGLLIATVALILIARKRTRGGWRWRWGQGD